MSSRMIPLIAMLLISCGSNSTPSKESAPAVPMHPSAGQPHSDWLKLWEAKLQPLALYSEVSIGARWKDPTTRG